MTKILNFEQDHLDHLDFGLGIYLVPPWRDWNLVLITPDEEI